MFLGSSGFGGDVFSVVDSGACLTICIIGYALVYS
jgi:hypothetical protein